jgi:diguanylate cyclase (GGDEF)-like protein
MWLKPKFRPRRLRTRLLVPIVTLLFFGSIGLKEVEKRVEQKQIEVSLEQEGTHVLIQIEQRLQEKQKAKESLVRLLAEREDVVALVKVGASDRLQEILKPWRGKLNLDSIAIESPKNSHLLQLGESRQDLEAPLIAAARSGGIQSRIAIDRQSLVLLASAPIRSDGKVIGEIVIGNSLNGNQIQPRQIENDVELALYHHNKLSTTTVEQADLLGFLLQSTLTFDRVEQLNRSLKKYHFYARATAIDRENLLVVLIPSHQLFAAVDRRELVESIVTLVWIVTIAIVGWLLSQKVARPLEDMVSVTKEIVLGNYQKQVASSNIKELNDLARTINYLAKQLEAKFADLTYRAFYDSLTNLPNRAFFEKRLQQAWDRARRHQNKMGVLFIDLDGFKQVNDNLGHEIGDRLLIEVGCRLQACLRSSDTLARLGGDEFIILLEDVSDVSYATNISRRINQQLKRKFDFDGHEVSISASIGVACSVPKGTHPHDFLRKADLAMYEVKKNGKANYQVFDLNIKNRNFPKSTLESQLNRAIEREEFQIYYQPVMQLATDRITEVEALVRWQHPDRGLIFPAEFLSVAEQTGLILPLGQWILEKACQQLQNWHSQYNNYLPLIIDVNLSKKQLQQPQFEREIAIILQKTGIDPNCLKLEIAESTIFDNKKNSNLTRLQNLKDLGVRLALDNYGKGLSAPNSLQLFPIDTLKIDRVLIEKLGNNIKGTAIVNGIIAFAKAIDLSITAEGIETVQQLNHLQTLGCDCAQGYYFAKPLTSEAMSLLLNKTSLANSQKLNLKCS